MSKGQRTKGKPAPKGHPDQVVRTPAQQAAASPAPDPAAFEIEAINGIGKMTEEARAELEQVRGHPVISYFLVDGAQLADEQMLHLYEHLRRIGRREKISLWLYSRGGSTVIPAKVVPLIREYCSEFAVLVPYRAQSSATMIALGADEIVMTEMSELGPVDPSRSHPLLPRVKGPDGDEMPFAVSVQDLRHVLSFIEREIGRDQMTGKAAATIYTALFDKVHPLAIGGLEQSYELAHQVSELVLASHLDPTDKASEIKRLAKQMGENYKEHTFPIGRGEARRAGLKVVDATPEEADAIWALFLAYDTINLNLEGQIDGQKAVGTRLGHIDSDCGLSLGTQLTSTKDPKKQMIGWRSVWSAEAKPSGS